MKLNAKAACTWLAVPLVAIAIAACGDDGSSGTPDPVDAEPAEEPGQGSLAECGDGILDESETTTEDCDGTANCTDECKENVCGDGFVGPGEDCDSDEDCNACRDPECGDGAVDQGEECDDANATNNDACTNSCNEATCGDSIVGPGEECDEGSDNGSSGASCTDACEDNVCGDGHVGPGEACDDMNAEDGDDCTNDCGLPSCGDGIVQTGEECDDGNTSDRDECLSSCVENVCGDGTVLAGTEECDDGNSSNADSCTNQCATNVCGDGFVGPGETCDEGEENADDGECSTSCGPTTCGDEVVQAGEECDDGNTNNADECSNNCVLAGCGDNVRQGDEECDDGNTSNADQCSNECVNTFCGDGFEGPGESCDDGNNVDGDGCQADCADPDCGDGVVDADSGEECDDGQNGVDTDECLDTCLLNVCGDGAALEGTEECDDGNTSDSDICTNSCENAVCGDGIVGPGEGCDDGNATDGDGCNDDPASAVVDCTPTDCGNGIADPGELCDDGNATDTDACLSTCAPASCGDSEVQAGVEGCDDGNASNADACLVTCLPAACGDGFLQIGVEECDLGALNGPGSQCSALCTVSQCGNGELDPGEECDDANNNNNDSCLSNCEWNECGDGAVYVQVTDSDNPNALEECDDNNAVESDLCLATCDYSRCSDGVLLTDNESEPYDDPDGTGIMTASRGGDNDVYHSGGDPAENLPVPFQTDLGGGACGAGESCRPGMLHVAGTIPTGSGLSAVNILHIDVEECDDDNLVNTDACLARNEDSDPEYECRVAYCNDGEVLAGTEQCDDGCGPLVDEEDCAALRDQNDSCLDTCVLNQCGDGWLYTTNTSGSATPPLEACDDGNTTGGDSCLANCSLPSCGNGVIDFTVNADGTLRLEECDNGASNADTGTAACSTTCRLTNASNPAILDYTCGNGTVNAGEECDDGGPGGDNNDSCLNNCQFNACGDGARYVVQTETNGPINPNRLEQCDDANDNNGDSCLDTCRWNTCGDNEEYRSETDGPNTNGLLAVDYVCSDVDLPSDDDSIALYNDCNAPDTLVNVASEALIPEECDDGNTVNNDLCSNSCEDAVCGDGILQAGETCDDGNDVSDDDCLSLDADIDLEDYCDDICEVDVSGSVDECLANCELRAQSCTANTCGDGFESDLEACDDGNGVDTDDCHNNCSFSSCGNNQGYTNGDDVTGDATNEDEECEDGNSNSNDGCTNLCLWARCGDGVLQVVNGEECDDGNDVNTDGCTSACTLPVCGDGVRQGAEQCDPGRLPEGDFATNETLATGTYLYANHNNTVAGDPILSHEDRDDGFIDEPFFCNPNTCQIRCNATADTLGRRWKDNNEWCVFVAEAPGQLNDADEEGFDGAFGNYTIYNETTGAYDPEEELYGWAAAREHCQSYGIGADLVVIRSAAENTQFLAVIDEADDDDYWWLGLNDTGTQVQEPNGVWRWLDGTPTDTFRNWSGPPNDPQRPDDSGSDEDCAGFVGSDADEGDTEGTWNDLVCQSDDVYVACEFRIPAAAP